MFPDVPHTGLPLSGLKVIDCTIWQQGTYAERDARRLRRRRGQGRRARLARPRPRVSSHATSRATTATSVASSST